MNISIVREYLETKKQRVKTASRLFVLQAQLSELETKEAGLASQVDQDSLITAKSVRIINELLSFYHPLWMGDFPVSFAHLTLKNGQLQVQIIFARPLFTGWKTETPYLSYQSCPWSLETPEPPSENDIPQYKQVLDGDWDIVCWERTENGLRLWTDEKRGSEFKWEGLARESSIKDESDRQSELFPKEVVPISRD